MDLICFEDRLILVLKPTQDHAILREDVKDFLQLAQMWHFMGLICLEDWPILFSKPIQDHEILASIK
jgi:hypothetical protein